MRARVFLLLGFAAALAFVPGARAVVTMNVEFAAIYQADGVTGLGEGKIGLLVADEGAVPGLVNAGGTTLSLGSYLGGGSDDRIIGITTSVADVGGTGFSGFQDLFASITYDGNFGAGDKLYLLWFPTISSIGSVLGGDVSYGVYRSDAVNLASGSDIAFIAPPDGSTNNLFAFASSIVAGSGVTKSDFTAKFTTVAVPEPGAAALLLFAATGIFFSRGWFRRAAFGLVSAGLLGASPVHAQIWQNPGVGEWSDPANWQGGVPVDGNGAYFGIGGVAEISSGTTHSYAGLDVAGSSSNPSTVHVKSNATLDADGGNVRLGVGFDLDAQRVYGPGVLLITGYDANVINAGAVSVGYNAGAGTLIINGGGSLASASGHIGNPGGGVPASGSSALVTGGGSIWTTGTLTVGAGATLTVSDGGRVVLGDSPGLVAASGRLAGDGIIDGSLTIAGTIAPGVNAGGLLTTGTQTWSAGGRYEWKIADATPVGPGSPGWDSVWIDGSLSIESTTEDPFVIELTSYGDDNLPGAPVDFDPTQSQTWALVTASGGITLASEDRLQVSAEGFQGARGTFTLAVRGNRLDLVYTAVPEAASTGLIVALVLGGLVGRRMKTGRRFCLVVVVAVAAVAGAARAQWVNETYALKPGWNGIWLSQDCSYATITDLLLAQPKVTQIWRWNPLGSAKQYVTTPENPIKPDAEWAVWRRNDAESSTLDRLTGNAGYLVFVDDADPVSLSLTGRPLLPTYNGQQKSGLIFSGFPIDPAASPLQRHLDRFLSFDRVLKSLPEGLPGVYFYNGGPFSASVPKNPLPVTDSSAVSMTRGTAYWIEAKSYTAYYGPVRVESADGDGLEFARSGVARTLRVKNVTDPAKKQSVIVTFTPAPSAAAPSNQAPVAGAVPLLLRGEIDPLTLQTSYTPFSTAIQRTIAPGETAEVTFYLDRSALGTVAGREFQSLIRLSDSLNLTRIDVPVHATSTSLAGLWVGQAIVSQVDQITGQTATLGSTRGDGFPIRLVVFVDAAGKPTLLQQAYVATDDSDNSLNAQKVFSKIGYERAASIKALSNSARVSSSAFPLDLVAPSPGGSVTGSATFDVLLDYAAPTNPFVHPYHPAHDNRDASFALSPLPAGAESYTVRRTVSLAFTPTADVTDPAWGSTMLGGTYAETVAGLRVADIRVAGVFVIKRVSDASELILE